MPFNSNTSGMHHSPDGHTCRIISDYLGTRARHAPQQTEPAQASEPRCEVCRIGHTTEHLGPCYNNASQLPNSTEPNWTRYVEVNKERIDTLTARVRRMDAQLDHMSQSTWDHEFRIEHNERDIRDQSVVQANLRGNIDVHERWRDTDLDQMVEVTSNLNRKIQSNTRRIENQERHDDNLRISLVKRFQPLEAQVKQLQETADQESNSNSNEEADKKTGEVSNQGMNEMSSEGIAKKTEDSNDAATTNPRCVTVADMWKLINLVETLKKTMDTDRCCMNKLEFELNLLTIREHRSRNLLAQTQATIEALQNGGENVDFPESQEAPWNQEPSWASLSPTENGPENTPWSPSSSWASVYDGEQQSGTQDREGAINQIAW